MQNVQHLPSPDWDGLPDSEKAQTLAEFQAAFGGEHVSARPPDFFAELIELERTLNRKLINLVLENGELIAFCVVQPLREKIFTLRSATVKDKERKVAIMKAVKKFLDNFQDVDLISKTYKQMGILMSPGFDFEECANIEECRTRFPNQLQAYLDDPNNPKKETDYEKEAAWFYVRKAINAPLARDPAHPIGD